MRTSLLRLERQRTENPDQVIDLLQKHYEELAAQIIASGRDHGYLGGDPLGALAHLTAPTPQLLQLTRQVSELWQTFFSSFRPDEAQFEARRFETDAAELNRRLQEVPIGQAPEIPLAIAMMDQLQVFWEERQDSVNERLDGLIDELSTHQRKLGSADLQRAHQSDELERASTLVSATLQELGESLDGSETLTDLLGVLVKRWRKELSHRRDLLEELRREHSAFIRALTLAADGKIPPDLELPDVCAKAVEDVADVVAAFREQESHIRDMERQQSELQARLNDHEQEINQRDELIARYEFGENDSGTRDERLELYRRIVARFEAGEDPSADLEAVRELERVMIMSEVERQRLHSLVDRHLETTAKTLQQLRKILPLGNDPKRYRPRLLGGSPYELKTLRGLLQATRDAGRDILHFTARARWVAGTVILERNFGKLRRVFEEMVRFIGECRDKLGGPPPASCTMNIGTMDGLASLPSVLAVDVKTLAKTRGGKALCREVMDILEETVAYFHEVLTKARGEDIERSQPERRETPSKAVVRLADELIDLAGIMEATFAEARANGWQAQPAEQALLEQEHLLLLGLKDLDAICEVIVGTPGAPDTSFDKLPSGRRSALDSLLACAKQRVAWLENLARFRIELRGKD